MKRGSERDERSTGDDRTQTNHGTLNGTVWYVSGNHVILTLENGQKKEYQVPESYKFIVEGQPKGVGDLRQGMKVTATKIVEEPQTELSTETVITGRAPKK